MWGSGARECKQEFIDFTKEYQPTMSKRQQMFSFAAFCTMSVVLASTEPSYSSGYSSTTLNEQQPRPVYLSPSKGSGSQLQGPQYLAAMINQLSTERTQIMGPTPVPDYDMPPLPISHGQLSNLYHNAVKQLNKLNLKPSNSPDDNTVGTDGGDTGSSPGYMYYYFPITDNPDEANTESSTDMNDMMMMMGDGNAPQTKQVEPLFVAIASFVGLSTLFAFSVLFLPKFGSRKRSETSNAGLTPLANRVMEALDSGPEKRTGEAPETTGQETEAAATTHIEAADEQELSSQIDETHEHGCPARLACEVGRALRKLQLHRGPLRALERILPTGMGKHVQRVRESAHRRDKCSTIRCQPD
ncbi:hypothetical protein B566_EDAN005064 [Ephemera danica]|nr:hypothetical protein B566_EDAN005064 [Ephemera danica]